MDSLLPPETPATTFYFPVHIPRPINDGSAVLAHDGYDVQTWQDAAQDYPRLTRALTEQRSHLVTAPALMRDLFWSFLKRAPHPTPLVPLSAAHRLNAQILEQIMSTLAWKQTRSAGTLDDPLSAAMATIGVAQRVLAALDDDVRAQVAALHDAESGMTLLFDHAESLEDLAQQASGDQASHLFAQAHATRTLAQTRHHDLATLESELITTLEAQEDRIRRTARRALEAADTEIESFRTTASAFGSLSLRDKISLAEEVGRSHRLQQIAALCGRMMRIALRVQASKVSHPPDEVTTITIGNDLAHVLPSELALLSDPDLEDLFLYRFAEAHLLQYALVGHEKQGQGPIIMALDSSGSMEGSVSGIIKEAWAKAVMLALLAIARKQKRDLAILHFSSADDPLVTFRFPKGASTYEEVLTCTETFIGNYTAFEPWMHAALTLVDESTFNRADVICVSDGLTTISPTVQAQWQQRRAARDMRAYGILIGTDEGAHTLAGITDAIMTLHDLNNDTDVLETIFNV
jgi:uncharacterized protein with von Willebrand factor type A (vWA) domain